MPEKYGERIATLEAKHELFSEIKKRIGRIENAILAILGFCGYTIVQYVLKGGSL